MNNSMKSVAVLLWLALFSLACNLGAPQATPIPPVTNTPLGATKPRVIVQSPASGTQFNVNQPIPVSVIATDETGVTRVQLFANGTLAKTVSSQNINGDPQINTILDFTPRTAGDVALRVVAYRGNTASDPAELTVRVGNAVIATSTSAPIIAPTPAPPSIPNDGVCRALTSTSVRLRSTPSTATDSNIITTLTINTLMPILARTPDNAWWKVNFNARIGWVSAAFTTIYGNCFSVPVESGVTPSPTTPPVVVVTATPIPPTAPPTTPPLSDLVITSIAGDSTISLGGAPSVTRNYSVTVTNTGLGAARNFSVTLTLNSTAPVDMGIVGELGAGQSITLIRPITFTGTGVNSLRADADPANTVNEVSNVNNTGVLVVTVNS